MKDTPKDMVESGENVELIRISTAGSVDDGKSTLIGRLLYESKAIYEDQMKSLQQAARKMNKEKLDLAFLTDGLKAEREQGITIDVAYRYFSTSKRRFILADTPGHVQYTRNMATGASTSDAVIILVDATQGIRSQTKKHGFIAGLLGIPHVILVINKMDLVDWSEALFHSIRGEFELFSAKLGFSSIVAIPVSALLGDNVVAPSHSMSWYGGPTVLSCLENLYCAPVSNLIDFRFPVQLALRPNNDFRGFAGQITSGIIHVGDEVTILPHRHTSKISRILVGFDEVLSAFAPQSATICLQDDVDVSRGDMIVRTGNQPHVSRELEAMVVWMAETSLRPHSSWLIKHTTNICKATVSEIIYRVDPDKLHSEKAAEIALNGIGRVRLTTSRHVYWDEYSRNRLLGGFVFIDPQTNGTSGVGMIIDRSHRKDDLRASLHITSQNRSDAKKGSVTPVLGLVSQQLRAGLFHNRKPLTLWLTGLSGAGKSTLGMNLEKRFIENKIACVLIDGDNLRMGLCKDLGFSRDDRSENIRRAAEVAKLFNEAGLNAVVCLISPLISDRNMARVIIGENRFVEIFVNTPLATCRKRDTKGLYAKAEEGVIPEFTGVSSPYEPPLQPDVIVDTQNATIEECLQKIESYLVQIASS